ncbi:hypothetical protein [Maricaulis sp.]|uniref:hypothetical protein n=1 Tax=Maricaulis sp. TaxID=1486257 RepID=UPI003A8E68D9
MTLNIKCLGLGLALAAGLSGLAAAQPDLRSIPVYEAPEPIVLQAETLQSFPAVEAGQGAAVDDTHFYAIVNFAIGQYDRESGERVGGWIGPRRGLIGHLNSCFEEEGRLYCANSNHPEVPMASSVEVFETEGLTHVDSHSLGLMDEGSLTWFDHYRDGWIVGFAHYNDETGEPFKSNAYGGVHTFDAQWRRTGGWRLPPALIERMAPQAASGGAIGSDGLLYVFGHHVPELYVLARPAMGPTLLHVATIELDAEGQAFAFDPADDRVIWAISRPNREVRAIRLPEVSLTDPDARRFDD